MTVKPNSTSPPKLSMNISSNYGKVQMEREIIESFKDLRSLLSDAVKWCRARVKTLAVCFCIFLSTVSLFFNGYLCYKVSKLSIKAGNTQCGYADIKLDLKKNFVSKDYMEQRMRFVNSMLGEVESMAYGALMSRTPGPMRIRVPHEEPWYLYKTTEEIDSINHVTLLSVKGNR